MNLSIKYRSPNTHQRTSPQLRTAFDILERYSKSESGSYLRKAIEWPIASHERFLRSMARSSFNIRGVLGKRALGDTGCYFCAEFRLIDPPQAVQKDRHGDMGMKGII